MTRQRLQLHTYLLQRNEHNHILRLVLGNLRQDIGQMEATMGRTTRNDQINRRGIQGRNQHPKRLRASLGHQTPQDYNQVLRKEGPTYQVITAHRRLVSVRPVTQTMELSWQGCRKR